MKDIGRRLPLELACTRVNRVMRRRQLSWLYIVAVIECSSCKLYVAVVWVGLNFKSAVTRMARISEHIAM